LPQDLLQGFMKMDDLEKFYIPVFDKAIFNIGQNHMRNMT